MKRILTIGLLLLAIPCLAQTINYGTGNQNQTESGNANFGQFNYVVTGSNGGGYTVNSCSLWVGSGGTAGDKIDCIIVAASSPTKTTATVLCHATYTETSTAPNGWVTLPMTGCGTLPANTAYWIGINTNDGGVSNGYYDCGGTCSGAAGSATYPNYYEPLNYGTYSALPTSSMTAYTEQMSVYITATPVGSSNPTAPKKPICY